MKKRQASGTTGPIVQATVVEVRVAVKGTSGTAVRPLIGIAKALPDGPVAISELVEPEDGGPHLAAEAIDHLADDHGIEPRTVQVQDEALAEHLHAVLGRRTRIEVVETLPDLDAAVRDLERHLEDTRPELPSPLEVPGVTTADLAAFGEAAGRFWRAAPWERLDSELDPIVVEAPRPDPTLRAVAVRGGGGASFGLTVVEHPDDLADPGEVEGYLDTHAMWFVELSLPLEAPRVDLEVWERLSLPRAGERIPHAFCVGPKDRVRRASPRILAFFSGLLDAIATATDDQLDSGRWSTTVVTRLGPQAFTLSLPTVLALDRQEPEARPFSRLMMEQQLREIGELLQGQRFGSIDEANAFLDRELAGRRYQPPSPRTPQETARQLAYRALDEAGRARTALAHRALALDPDSSDALVALAASCRRQQDALPLLEQAVAAAERSLGPDFVALRPGDFWSMPATRPYMRARLELAMLLAECGELDRAIGHYRELLRLNPGDNQGVRDRLFPALVLTGDLAGAQALLKRYETRGSAHFEYNRALLRFAQGGDGKQSRDAIAAALEANPEAAEILLDGLDEPPPTEYSPGSPEEADVYAYDCLRAWQAVPGALDWLLDRLEAPPPHRRVRKPATAATARATVRRRGR